MQIVVGGGGNPEEVGLGLQICIIILLISIFIKLIISIIIINIIIDISTNIIIINITQHHLVFHSEPKQAKTEYGREDQGAQNHLVGRVFLMRMPRGENSL